MEQTQTRLINLPVIGRVQHGEKLKNKVTEYGYFIAKSDDAYMKKFLDKFDEEYKGKQNIEIEFFDEERYQLNMQDIIKEEKHVDVHENLTKQL